MSKRKKFDVQTRLKKQFELKLKKKQAIQYKTVEKI